MSNKEKIMQIAELLKPKNCENLAAFGNAILISQKNTEKEKEERKKDDRKEEKR